jgi:hypothetical protein
MTTWVDGTAHAQPPHSRPLKTGFAARNGLV